MTTEDKALALVNGVKTERGRNSYSHYIRLNRALDDGHEALYRAIEQREAAEHELHDFKQKVSGKVGHYISNPTANNYADLKSLTIPAPKPDPLVKVLEKMGWYNAPNAPKDADQLRAALAARGLEIREKNDD